MITDSILQLGTRIRVLYITRMKRKLAVVSLHFTIWLLIVGAPILISVMFQDGDRPGIHLPLPFWITIGLLIVIFYLNYYVFIPRFLFTKRYIIYALILIGFFFLMIKSVGLILTLLQHNPPPRMENDDAARGMFSLLFTNLFLMYVTVFFSSIALRMMSRWQQTEEERFNAQLSYMTSQINPHFLFNTLNSIYGLTIVEAPKAADMVGKLSEMMRYTLDSSRNEMVPLSEELDYLKGYIDLQKVRLDENVLLEVSIEEDGFGHQIAPLILLPFIENAFKYGVNAEQNSNIKIHIKTDEKNLKFTAFNNKVDVDSQNLKKTGFGIENTQKRLELIYPEKHELELIENEYDFTVKLQLQLK